MYDSFTFLSKKPAGAPGDPVTTDAFADIELSAAHQGHQVTPLTAPSSGPISVNWKNTGANSIDTRVLGSNDATLAEGDWDVVIAAAALATTASRHIVISPASYQFYRFQHKATGAGSQGASQLRGCQKRI